MTTMWYKSSPNPEKNPILQSADITSKSQLRPRGGDPVFGAVIIPCFLILAGIYRALYPVPYPVPRYLPGDEARLAALAMTPSQDNWVRRHVEKIMLQQRAMIGAPGDLPVYNDNEIRAISRAMLRYYTPLRPILVDPALNPRFKRAIVELAMTRKLELLHSKGKHLDLSTVYPIPQEEVDRLWGPLAMGYI